MSSLSNKIDFAVIISVKNANPNGDPLNGNRPRTDYDGFGEISNVCLKRKIRDRLQDGGNAIFVQSDEKKTDGYPSLRARAEGVLGKETLNAKKTKPEKAAKKACDTWFDVRSFGQLFAFKSEGKDGVSIPIRGPVSIQSAFSIEPVSVTSIQITKSVSGDGDGSKKSSDTMGVQHRVDSAVYVFYGAMSPQLAEKTGFSDEDASVIKSVLPRMFEGDASSARPEGSMKVEKVIWWAHNSKGQYSSAKVHGTLSDYLKPEASLEKADLEQALNKFGDLKPEIIEGF